MLPLPRARPNVPDTFTDARRQLAGYYGLCESLDFETGRLLAALNQMDLTNDTLVVFNSDHGDMLGSHGLKMKKNHPQDESLHIPLFMRWPGVIKPGQVTSTLMSTIDLMPTILSLCGLPSPAGVRGLDKSAAVLGRTSDVESVYSQGLVQPSGQAEKDRENQAEPGAEWRCLVTQTHKLVVRRDPTRNRLWDLRNDPYEMNNLWEREPVLRDGLIKQLQHWGQQTSDPFPEGSHQALPMYADPMG